MPNQEDRVVPSSRFDLCSSLFTLRVRKGAGTHMRLAWGAGGLLPPHSVHLCKISPTLALTSHSSDFTLQTSLFTLHSSRSERGRDPHATGLGGWWVAAPTASISMSISAKSRQLSPSRRSHVTLFRLHSSLFTLHSSRSERGRDPHVTGLEGWRVAPPPPRLPSLQFSSQPRHLSSQVFCSSLSGRPHARAASSLGLGWHAE